MKTSIWLIAVALFFTAGCLSSSHDKEQTEEKNGSVMTEEIDISSGPVAVSVSTRVGIPTSDDVVESGKVAVMLHNNTISIKPKKHDSCNDIMIVMGHNGGNSLFDIKSVCLTPNTDINVDLNFSDGVVSKFTNPTDWFMPIKCRAVNQDADYPGDNQHSGYFTGGNHRSNNTGWGGVVTAIENDLKFYADDNEITETNGMYCDSIRIEWNNSIQGYNTTRADGNGVYIVKEHFTITIDNTGKMNILIRLEPLKDMVLEMFYGFGWYGTNGNKYYYKGEADTNSERKKYTIGTNTENSGTLYATEMVIENDIVMHCGINNSLDLGRLEHIGTYTYNYFNVSQKMYPMVVGEDTSINTGDNRYLGGYYQFD